VSLSSTLLLGLVAGVTILLGLPLGRLRSPAPGLRVALNATAIGVLLFLFWDVLSAAWEPLDAALGALGEGSGSAAPVVGYGVLFAAGLTVGMLALVAYESWMRRRTAAAPRRFGPGAMTAGELRGRTGTVPSTGSPARQLAFLIAVGIGLHNFAEGLAIGQSAAGGEIALATLLVVGFALHNATEGFGIVAPLAAAGERPSWALLALLGLIGGGPTFVGAALGHGFTSEPVSVAFLTLAAGSILYVIVQLVPLATRAKRPTLLACGLLLGLLAGFATDAVVTAAGV